MVWALILKLRMQATTARGPNLPGCNMNISYAFQKLSWQGYLVTITGKQFFWVLVMNRALLLMAGFLFCMEPNFCFIVRVCIVINTKLFTFFYFAHGAYGNKVEFKIHIVIAVGSVLMIV